MIIRTSIAALVLAFVSLVPRLDLALSANAPWTQATAGAPARIIPIGEVKPGMVGIGRTVFEGAELTEFKVHILGVLRNIQGPKRDLILARLEGGPLAKTGVAAGMSG